MSEAATSDPAIPSADPELLSQILAERSIETQPYQAGLGDYVEYVSSRGWEALRESTRSLFGGLFDFDDLSGAFDFLGLVAQLLLVALALVCLIWLYRWWRGTRVTALTVLPAQASSGPMPREGMDWEAELQRRLALDDGRGSLEALWWWLATRLGITALPGEAEAALTTRELLERTGRRDLRRPAQTLDRWLYAEPQPQVAAIGQLFEEFRRILPGRNESSR